MDRTDFPTLTNVLVPGTKELSQNSTSRQVTDILEPWEEAVNYGMGCNVIVQGV